MPIVARITAWRAACSVPSRPHDQPKPVVSPPVCGVRRHGSSAGRTRRMPRGAGRARKPRRRRDLRRQRGPHHRQPRDHAGGQRDRRAAGRRVHADHRSQRDLARRAGPHADHPRGAGHPGQRPLRRRSDRRGPVPPAVPRPTGMAGWSSPAHRGRGARTTATSRGATTCSRRATPTRRRTRAS